MEKAITTVSFETWRRRFEEALVHRSPASAALQSCTEWIKQRSSDLPPWLTFLLADDPDWANDIHRAVLRLIYNVTMPAPPIRKTKMRRDAHTRVALRRLTEQAESFVQNLQHTALEDGTAERVMITPGHNLFIAINLAPLLIAYQSAAAVSRYFLDVLERPYSRDNLPSAFTGGISMLQDLFRVPEREALALVRLALLAHGYPEVQLEEMRNPDKIRDGLFRKRRRAGQNRIDSLRSMVLREPATKRPIVLKSGTFYIDSPRKK